MWRFRRRDPEIQTGATALADWPDTQLSPELLQDEIDRLTEQNLASPSAEIERRLLSLRNQIGVLRLLDPPPAAEHPQPAFDSLPPGDPLPEIAPAALTPELLRAGILRDGCVLVRGLIPREHAVRFAEQIERVFTEREQRPLGQSANERLYSEFTNDPRFGEDFGRDWIRMGGGVLAVDAPGPAFEMFELFRQAGLPELVEAYLGEPPLITGHKTTLRKAEPSVAGAWHQDGKFMGPVRALNLWLSLSRCGDESPGLDIVPRRLDAHVTTQTDEALLDYAVSQRMAEAAAGDKPIVRPIFEPGDALLFDELFLHKTGSDPSMPKPRYAIENWFFGASAFPREYAPLAV